LSFVMICRKLHVKRWFKMKRSFFCGDIHSSGDIKYKN